MMILFVTDNPEEWLAKAEQLGLFDMPVHVAASVDKHGRFRAAHIARRKVRAHEPAKPVPHSADLFGGDSGTDSAKADLGTAKKAKKLTKFLAKHGGAARMAATLKEMTPEQRAKLIDAMAHLDGLTVGDVHDLLGMADHGLDKLTADAAKPAADTVTMPRDEAIQEHERLVSVLESPSHADDKIEAKKQAAELAEYKQGDTANAETPTAAAKEPDATASSAPDLVEYTTKKGKVLRGIVRKDIDGHQAKAIDPYTFRYQGGWFIREKHLAAAGEVSGAEKPVSTAAEAVAAIDPEAQAKAEAAARAERAKKQADKLREVADKTIAAAQAEQNRDRNTNTARRARMASGILERAAAAEAIGQTMHNLANAIESGEAQHLSGVTSRAAVEELDVLLIQAMYQRDRSENLSYAEQQSRKGRGPEPADIMHARLPRAGLDSAAANRSKLLEMLKGKRGAKGLIDSLRYTPDLTPEKFAELKKYLTDDQISDVLGWYNVEAVKRLGRLARMGIDSNDKLRMALTEYVMYRNGAKKPDPVKTAEMALVGQKVGIDFFPTPKSLASRMAELAGVKEGMRVLEPSAGNGNLADAAKAAGGAVDTYEVSDTLRNILKLKGHNVAGHDFMDATPEPQYDAVIMNPPFSNRMDAEHIQHAWGMVKPGGKLVAIAGEGVFFGSDKKAQAFRDWLDQNGADVEKLPEGTFLDKNLPSTTGVNARLIVLEKPAEAASDSGSVVQPDAAVKDVNVETMMTDRTYKNWKRQGVPILGTVNGWTLFRDDVRGSFVLMTPFNSARFDTEQNAREWAKENKAVKGDFNELTNTGPKDGDRNAEGLIFRDGRWHRDGEDVPKSDPHVELAEAKADLAEAVAADPSHPDIPALAAKVAEKHKAVTESATPTDVGAAGVDDGQKWAESGRTKPQEGDEVFTENPAMFGGVDYVRGVVKNGKVHILGVNTAFGDVPSDRKTSPLTARWTKKGEKSPYQKQVESQKADQEADRKNLKDSLSRVAFTDVSDLSVGKLVSISGSNDVVAVASVSDTFVETDDGKTYPIKEGKVLGLSPVANTPPADTAKDDAPAADGGPREGDRNADGLVFRNGRWHREDVNDTSVTDLSQAVDSIESANDAQTDSANSSDSAKLEKLRAKVEQLGGKEKVGKIIAAQMRNSDSLVIGADGAKSRAATLIDSLADTFGVSREAVAAELGLKKKTKRSPSTDGGRTIQSAAGSEDDPNSPNYRFRDTGYIANSRKEMAANMLRTAAKEGRRVNANEVDWESIEHNPREAKELIVKSNLFGQVPWDSLKEQGMEPSAGFLIDRVYASIAKEPEDNPQARKDYALGLQSLRDRLEKCKTPQQVTDVLKEIRDEQDGVILTAEESAAYAKHQEKISEMHKEKRELDTQCDELYDKWNKARGDFYLAQREVENRKRRGWKPSPELDAKLQAATLAQDVTHKAWSDKLRDVGPRRTELREAISSSVKAANAIQEAAIARNKVENPLSRAWNSLGDRFKAVVNYRRSSGSDAFRNHVASATGGNIKDWSWAETTGAIKVKRATKEQVRFQLRVAENLVRKGGRAVKVASTEDLKRAFGLRDVQSGNWVLKDPASAKFHVENCAAAFSDLADLFGVPDEQVSMNGRLAMAFGARGAGAAGGKAAKAHYEPVHRVINLTKMAGGGSLAHEWAHALDNMVKEAVTGETGKVNEYASENPDILPAGELRDAFRAVRAAMLDSDGITGQRALEQVKYTANHIRQADYNINRSNPSELARMIAAAGNAEAAVIAVNGYFDGMRESRRKSAAMQDWKRIAVAYYDRNPDGATVATNSGPMMSSFAVEAMALDAGGKPYWAETHEMFARAFHAYVEDKLAEQGRESGYLASYGDNKYHIDPLTGTQFKPFPEGEERKRINAAFDKLVAAVRGQNVLAKALARFGMPKVVFFTKAA